MGSPGSWGRPVLPLLLATLAAGLASCLAGPPAEEAPSRLGSVRAASRERAREVAALLDELAPRVEGAVPELTLRDLEVWVQESPTLYAFRSRTYSDADGFWAEGVRRIHLRERAEQAERTLAHELVHAGLGPTWRALPGTLEEGLCDLVAARLCPDAAPRLRAGRLASAALAIGGLCLEFELWLPAGVRRDGLAACSLARVRLLADPPVHVEPGDVFVVQAGLSSSSATSAEKKAFYGLGFLAAERIEERIGLSGLHGLCAEALSEGRASIPVDRLHTAADLTPGPHAWRQALAEAFGPSEVREVLRLHPEMLVRCVVELLEPLLGPGFEPAELARHLSRIRGRVGVVGSRRGHLELENLAGLRTRLEAALASSAAPTAAP